MLCINLKEMGNKKNHILLCEDDPNLGNVLKNYLELNDYDVTGAGTAGWDWQLFQRERIWPLSVRRDDAKYGRITSVKKSGILMFPCFWAPKPWRKISFRDTNWAPTTILQAFDSEVLLQKSGNSEKETKNLIKNQKIRNLILASYHFNPNCGSYRMVALSCTFTQGKWVIENAGRTFERLTRANRHWRRFGVAILILTEEVWMFILQNSVSILKMTRRDRNRKYSAKRFQACGAGLNQLLA